MIQKPEKWLKPWQMGTHLRVLSESYPINTNMTGFRWFSKILPSWVLDESSLGIIRVKHTLNSYTREIMKTCHKNLFVGGIYRTAIFKTFKKDIFWRYWYFWHTPLSCCGMGVIALWGNWVNVFNSIPLRPTPSWWSHLRDIHKFHTEIKKNVRLTYYD